MSLNPFPLINRYKNRDFKSPDTKCFKHPFCDISTGRHFTDLDNSITMPFQCGMKDPADLQNYASLLVGDRKLQSLKE